MTLTGPLYLIFDKSVTMFTMYKKETGLNKTLNPS